MLRRHRPALLTLALAAALVPAARAAAQTAPAPPAPAVATAKPPNIIAEVRAAIAKGDFAGGEALLNAYRASKGTTPEALEALSWLGRGALAAKQLDKAENYALETYDLCVEALKTRPMDAEPRLPIAIGAAIEVRAHVHAERGARADAVYLLQQELATYRTTSIRTRIQKNINLLSLEGKPAPTLDTAEYLGTVAPGAVAALKGKPVVLFFWAHWCPDCKAMSTVLETLLTRYRDQGLTVVSPDPALRLRRQARAGAAGRGDGLHRAGPRRGLSVDGPRVGAGERREPEELRRQHDAHGGARRPRRHRPPVSPRADDPGSDRAAHQGDRRQQD